MDALITLLLIIALLAVAVFIGLALGNVFAKNKPVPKNYECDYNKCNEQLTNWVKKQQGDLDNSTNKIQECRTCPSRSYSQITNEVKKYGAWKAYKTTEDAMQAIIL
jgi:hypothetical protein